MAKVKRKVVYVLSQEHYHFPPNDSDMVASTPIEVRAGTDTGRIDLKTKAKKLAEKHATRFDGYVKEYQSTNGHEYRVWVDSPSPHCDKFVWVVRETEYVG